MTAPFPPLVLAAVAAAILVASAPALAAGAVGCLIEPERVAELGTPTAGIIRQMLVERGDRVRRGQPIAVLQDDIERASADVAHSRAQTEAEVRAAQATLELAQQRTDRSKDLHAKGFISMPALEQSTAETRLAQERLLQAREQKRALEKEFALARVRLGERTIRSPFDGVVVERYFTAGERVEEKPMVRIAKVDPLRVEVILPSTMYGNIKTGSIGRIAPDLPGMEALAATVTLVDRVLDAASGTFRVRMLLPNPEASIPAGLRCRADFEPRRPNDLHPERAIAAVAAAAQPAYRLKMDLRPLASPLGSSLSKKM